MRFFFRFGKGLGRVLAAYFVEEVGVENVAPAEMPPGAHGNGLQANDPEAADYLLRRLVKDYRVIAVHFGLPCGTCSKASGIPMANGSPGPQLLRDFSHLHGLPDLSDRDRLKVEAANALYRWA